jgi:predicted aspartyl protease
MIRRPVQQNKKSSAQQPNKLTGNIRNHAFFFTLNVNETKVPNIMLDTGAVELTFNGRVAKALRLPNLGSVRVSGIGGTTRAYRSRCNLKIGRNVYRHVPCIVVPEFTSSGLFGLRFFIDNQLKLELNPKAETFLISPT